MNPTWICSYRSGRILNFALSFMTNVTKSISISQAFRSWVEIFHLHPPVAFLSRSSYDMIGLPLMTVLLWGRRDIQISFSAGIPHVSERLKLALRKFYGRYGDLIKEYDALSRILNDILEHINMQWYPPLIRHCSNSWPCYRTGHYYQVPNSESFHRTFAMGVAC